MRDVYATRASEVPDGSELYSGSHDGMLVETVHGYYVANGPPSVRFTLGCGCSEIVPADRLVTWLEPSYPHVVYPCHRQHGQRRI